MTDLPDTGSSSRGSRRRWLWWVAGSALAVVLIVIGVVVVNSQPSPAATRHAALTASLKLVRVSVDAVGGKWTYEDGTEWVPGDSSGYVPGPCGTVSSSYSQYDVLLLGPIQPDPEKMAEKVAKFWKSLGYSVRLVYHDGPAVSNAIQIAVDLPNRAIITYSASTIESDFEATSECFPTPDD